MEENLNFGLVLGWFAVLKLPNLTYVLFAVGTVVVSPLKSCIKRVRKFLFFKV